MPGVGDFNLRSFFRAMGIKNPQPSMREFVQPVIVVGDMSEITPQYRPPTGYFGGDIAGFAAEFSFFQVISRAEGGTLTSFSTSTNFMFGTVVPDLPTFFVDPWPIAAQLSVEAPVSLVRAGHTATQPIVANRAPTITATNRTIPANNGRLLWIPPGQGILFFGLGVNASINDFACLVIDLPASENSIL